MGPPARGKPTVGPVVQAATIPNNTKQWHVLSLPDAELGQTVFGSRSGGMEIQGKEEEDLLALFKMGGATKSRTKDPKSGLQQKAEASVGFVDAKKAYLAGIVLAQFKVKQDYGRIAAALSGDPDEQGLLTASRVQGLLSVLPTKAELDKCIGYKGKVKLLGEAEQFYRAVGRVTRLEARLRLFEMKLSFEHSMDSVKQQAATLQLGCDQLRGSSSLAQVLELLLGMANTINRRKVNGFRLASLLTLVDTKSTANAKVTLLHFLAKVLWAKHRELYDFDLDLQGVHAAARLDLEVIRSEFAHQAGALKAARDELSRCVEEGSSAPLVSTLDEFCNHTAPELLLELHPLVDLTAQTAAATAAYFGERPSAISAIFEVVTKFVNMYKQIKHEALSPKSQRQLRQANDMVSVDV
eukprot:TRINITY_DN4711_c0_g1_i14.p1 TRINITY_DN4711_c0_g1~~TRINITY_DN4711_c0_g1_i14.p1  ORF type:complete len:411 (+),score=127.91 TRINITY_DN4711_c0_g1_i14:221-1453(+)